jgi:hypothetical protein
MRLIRTGPSGSVEVSDLSTGHTPKFVADLLITFLNTKPVVLRLCHIRQFDSHIRSNINLPSKVWILKAFSFLQVLLSKLPSHACHLHRAFLAP